MKTNRNIETEVRGVFRSAKWNKHFTKTASKVIEEIRKENGFGDFTTKERVAILEIIAQTLMNFDVHYMTEIKKLKRDVVILTIITGLLTGVILGVLFKAIKG